LKKYREDFDGEFEVIEREEKKEPVLLYKAEIQVNKSGARDLRESGVTIIEDKDSESDELFYRVFNAEES